MRTGEILGSMEHIDLDLIEEADTYSKVRKTYFWVKGISAAACLCLVAAGTVTAARFLQYNTATGNNTGNGILTGEPIQPTARDNSDDGSSNSVPGAAHVVNAGEEPAGITDYTEIKPVQNEVMTDAQRKEHKEAVGKMIDQYDISLNCDADMAVNNGCCVLSGSLKAAIEEYGDSVAYRVVVEVFRDGTVTGNSSAEVLSEEARLAAENYIVAHEKYEDGAGGTWDYFTIHAKADQILHFSVNDWYGYYITFYSEHPGLNQQKEEADVSFNVTPDQPVDESSSYFLQADEYPAEILAVQEHISRGMISGELSFIYESAIYENPLRIEVSVGVVDEEKIEDFKALYDPDGKYIVIRQGAKPVQSQEVIRGRVESCYDSSDNPVKNQNYDVGEPVYEDQ